ncbi:MAG: hypothetical protein IJZ53_12805 [Tyzzerella sp.]|nr:hypothetical protein [Tyzzerella sp.]
MTIEEFDRISSELNGKELIDFINRHPKVANKWTEQFLKEISYLDVTLDKKTSQEIWNRIVHDIQEYERFKNVKHLIWFTNKIFL